MSDSIAYERRGPAALVRIVRPERRNAIDGATADALHTAFTRFVTDDGARALVLTGDATAFSAGADLKAIETLRDRDEGPLGITRLHSPKPTIAAVTGYCVAGGLELALWCDLRVAGESAGVLYWNDHERSKRTFHGDRVRTGPSGYAAITYADGSASSLGPGSELVLDAALELQPLRLDALGGVGDLVRRHPAGRNGRGDRGTCRYPAGEQGK